MSDAVYFMRQVNEFIANHPEHPLIVEYNKGNVGLGYLIRHWQELNNANYSDQRQGSCRENNLS